jgi:uncharacterized oxidoreductase
MLKQLSEELLSMNLLEEVRPGANRYISGAGVLAQLEDLLRPFNQVAVITGEISYQVFQNYYQGDFNYPVHLYDGSASDEDGERLAAEITTADVVVAIGGGRLLDTAKLATEILGCELIMIPTLISNCAPYAPIVAVYTQAEHQFKRIGATSKAGYISLVDWEFLLATPRGYLIAGIGDTLAKWYEIEGITRHLSDAEKTAQVRLGIAVAKEVLAILKADGQLALAALEQQKVTPEFGRIADTIIALAGGVGGFAGKYGRIAGAHAIHNGLSLLPETHEVLHGAKVAYGVLVQLAYTGDFDEIDQLLPWYHELTLPTNLAGINVATFDQKKLLAVAEFAGSDIESFKQIDPSVTADGILKAVEKIEEITKK